MQVIKGGTVTDAASKIAAYVSQHIMHADADSRVYSLPVMVDHIASKPDKKRRDDVMEYVFLSSLRSPHPLTSTLDTSGYT